MCLATSGHDFRVIGLVGSAYTPVTCPVLIYGSGEVEFGSLGNLAVSSEGVDF